MTGTMTVRLQGYPEAVLARESVAFVPPAQVTAEDVVRHVAGLDDDLLPALTREDGRVRESTKVIADGSVKAQGELLGSAREVTLLAALPCDG